MIDSNRPKIREIMNLKQNFSLLFFEHGFAEKLHEIEHKDNDIYII